MMSKVKSQSGQSSAMFFALSTLKVHLSDVAIRHNKDQVSWQTDYKKRKRAE
jgi:hypothetical protein